jgi:hypothetical protein
VRFGLVLGIGLAAAFGVLALLLFYGSGPPTRVYGRVIKTAIASNGRGARPAAIVEVDSHQAIVTLPLGMICNPGGRIELMREKALLGYQYGVGVNGCASNR